MHFKDRDRWIVKILGAERGCWISGCCLLMWVFIHRYRHLMKKYLISKDELAAMQKALDEAKRSQVVASQLPITKPQTTVSGGPPTTETRIKSTTVTDNQTSSK
jgi:hypothetical protein